MKICLALLTSREIENKAKKMAVEIDRKYNTGLLAALLPFHVSLKQSFEVENIIEIENYFDLIAKSIKPFEVSYSKINLIKMGESGIIWMDINENSVLRNLHDRLNKDLLKNNNIPNIGFDGDEFHFHSTISFGGQPYSMYEKIYDEINQEKLNLKCIINEIAMFYSSTGEPGSFIMYKTSKIDK